MTVAITIDAIPYLIQPANGPSPIAHTRVQPFHDRCKVESFVQKMLVQNHEQLPAIRRLVAVNDSSAMPVESALVDQLLEKALLVVRDASASGGRASRPPTAAAVPPPPKVTDQIDGSTLLSTAMKTYLKESESGAVEQSQNQRPDQKRAVADQVAAPENNHYQVVIEVAGQHLAKKHSLILKTAQGETFKKYVSDDHRSAHRSLCRFSSLQSGSCEVALAIPMKGCSQPMALPLHHAIPTIAKGIEKTIWDTVLVPVKPLQFLTRDQQKQQADLLHNGWLYVFWKGRLWRELKVSRHGVLQDVNLEYYRALKTSRRKAEGHWLDAVWVPFLINGQQQTELVFAASAVQWSWGAIEAFEADASNFQAQSAPLKAVSNYQGSQLFDEAPMQSGAIENARVLKQNQPLLDRQKRQKIAAAYLPKVGAKLKVYLKDDLDNALSNVDFELKVGEQIIQARTDSTGYLEALIPHNLKESDIHFFDQRTDTTLETFSMKLADTEPVETIKGLQARLNNLGFEAGPVDGINGRKTKSATREFQTKHNLTIDGISGPQTQQQLLTEHQS